MASRAASWPGHRLRGVYAGVAPIVSDIARTLGPAGGPVRFAAPDGTLATTTDPLVICEFTAAGDPEADLGTGLIRALVGRTRARWSDGAATAAVVAQAMMASVLGSVERGVDPTRLGAQLLELGEAVVDDLNGRAVEVATKHQIAQVIAAATGDGQGAETLVDAADTVGKEGVIAVEEHGVPGVDLESRSGIFLPSRRRSGPDDFPKFTVANPLVVVLPEPRTEALWQRACQWANEQGTTMIMLSPGAQPDTIVADTTVEDPLTLPAADPLAVLADTAALIGAELSGSWNPVVAREAAVGPSGIYLEPAWTVAMDKVQARVVDLGTQLRTARTAEVRQRLWTRRAWLAGATATVWVGPLPGQAAAEFAVRKDLLTRAKNLILPSVEQGYLGGGGAAMRAAGTVLDAGPDSPAQQAMRDGLLAPLTHLAASCGYTPDQAHASIAATPGATGIEVTTGRATNMTEAGVLDTAAVVTDTLTAAVDTTRKFLALA